MSWTAKVEKKLSGLADSASKESIQTISKWLGFNRKQSDAINSVLASRLQDPTSSAARKWLYWQIVHEVLVQNSSDPDVKKWDRMQDFRTALGESVVIPSIEAARTAGLGEKILTNLVPIWDDVNSFGGPTLIGQIKRKINGAPLSPKTAPSKSTPPEPTPVPTPSPDHHQQSEAADLVQNETETRETAEASEEKPKDQIPNEGAVEEKNFEQNDDSQAGKADSKPEEGKTDEVGSADDSKPAAEETKKRSRPRKDIKYDFDSKNIPEGTVEAREFFDPCKAIATLQIARDLRNDGAVQLGALLDKVPNDIIKVAEEGKKMEEAGETMEIMDDVARDYSIRLGDEILDKDLDEEIHNVNTFREIVERQRTARERLIHLLIKSRCKFGSEDTAAAFLQLEDVGNQLKERKRQLKDAMELEGLDFETDEKEDGNDLNELEPLTWFNPNVASTSIEGGDADATESNKKQKTTDS